MMGSSPRCYILSLVEIGGMVLEKIFEGVLTYMDIATILVMLPASCHTILISLYLKAYIQNLIENGPLVSEKSPF